MGKMKKELVMVFNGEMWDYVFDISKSIYANLDTDKKAIDFINMQMETIDFSINIENNMMFIITDNEMPCNNC